MENVINAAEFIHQRVETALTHAKRAEKLFQRRNDSIHLKANRSVGMLVTNADTGEDIKSEARAACDDFYNANQQLIAALDGLCRPALEDKPGREAVKAVYETVKHLNSESEVANYFTSSLFGLNFSDLVGKSYAPSEESLAIQLFWEEQYKALEE